MLPTSPDPPEPERRRKAGRGVELLYLLADYFGGVGFFRFLAAVLCVIVGCYLGALGSCWVAAWLFDINAPYAAKDVQNGYGFQLYVSVAGGGVMGALTAIGAVSRWPVYRTYCGAITTILLLVWMAYFMVMSHPYEEVWEGPDLLALPLLLAVSLLAWGVRVKTRTK